MKLNFT